MAQQDNNDSMPFEQALAQLEAVARELDEGKLGLAESLNQYEKGVALLKLCHGQLNQAEQRIMQLMGLDENGQPQLQPFEHTATAEAGAERKRTRGTKP